MTTLKPAQLNLWELNQGQSPSYREDTHASLRALPGSEGARMMTVGSGLKCSGLLKNSDHVGLLVRTLLVTPQWASTACYLTWKIAATPQGRLLFRLVPSMPHTEETEFSFWPTPNVPNGGRQAKGISPTGKTLDGQKRQVGLSKAVKMVEAKMWPTPRAADGDKMNQRYPGGNLTLTGAAKLLPTPNARDWRSGKGREENGHSPQLPEVIGGQLNPAWVEWLMGFPPGWTDLEDSETP